jgi:formylglycine-generating enzyme required for sulfatase activity
MLRNFAAVAVLLLVVVFAGCARMGAEKEGAGTEETAASSVPETPAVTPGEMVLIPAGEFTLGGDDPKSYARPQQKMHLPAYWIDKYEVTNQEFLDFAIKTGYQGEGAKEGKDWRAFVPAGGKVPVVYITWKDAKAYCESLGKRLPTEFEWEKAARGTDGLRFPWGNEWDATKTNTYEAGITKPAEIARYSGDVSPFGVHDMMGNVQEWTDSWFKPYKGSPDKSKDFGETMRVVRGASARYYGARAHLYNRSAYVPNSLYDFGCRCAKDEPSAK